MLLGKGKGPGLAAAAAQNAWKICKAVVDVARAGLSELQPKDLEFTSKEIAACKKQLGDLTRDVQGVPDGLNPLEAAIHVGAYEAVRVLAPVYSKHLFCGVLTPLMLFLQLGFRQGV